MPAPSPRTAPLRSRLLGRCLFAPLLALALPGAAIAHAVDSRYVFGMQYVPKFNDRTGHGEWSGSRDRGIAFHRDLGVEVSREGLIWRQWEPQAPGVRPNLRDFDDVVARLADAGIAMQAMVTETPYWASTAPAADPHKPETFKSAPPRGLYQPIFADGTDTPGPNKALNPHNTWATALGSMVSRYRGKVRYWQVWNEPDYPKGDLRADYHDPSRSWNGSVEDYVRLLKVGYTVVKSRDPHARVVTGGLGFGPYLQAVIDRGGGHYFDLIDFHAYGWPGSDTALGRFVQVASDMHRVLARNGLGAKGMICSETGYSSLDPQTQADYIAKLYPTAIALGMESTMYYANVNPSWKAMGLIDWRTMSQKTLGYWAYKNAALALHGVRDVEPLTIKGATAYRFARQDGSRVTVLWAPHHDDAHPLSVAVPLAGQHVQIRDALGRLKGQATGHASLALTSSPLFLDTNAALAYAPIRPNAALPHVGIAIANAMADSTSEQSGPPSAAIDTDTDTNWVNGQYKQPEAWLAVALSQPSSVRGLRVKTGPTPAGTWFDVEVSTDGKRYTPVLTHQRLSSWHMEALTLPNAVNARYVRLHWHNPERRPVSFSVFELEVH